MSEPSRQPRDSYEQFRAARAMERVEAAVGRQDRGSFSWNLLSEGLGLMVKKPGQSYLAYVVPWSAIRDDEQDPLLAAEQAAMEELKDG